MCRLRAGQRAGGLREGLSASRESGASSQGDTASGCLTFLHHQQSPIPRPDTQAQHLHPAHIDSSITALCVPDVKLSLMVTEEAGRGKRGQAAPELGGSVGHLLPWGHFVPVPCDRANGQSPSAGIEGAGQEGSDPLLGTNLRGLGHPESTGSWGQGESPQKRPPSYCEEKRQESCSRTSQRSPHPCSIGGQAFGCLVKSVPRH